MLVSFVLTLMSVAHIFEIPFMVFNPNAIKKSNVTLSLCNTTSADQSQPKAPVMDRLMMKDIGSKDAPFLDIGRFVHSLSPA